MKRIARCQSKTELLVDLATPAGKHTSTLQDTCKTRVVTAVLSVMQHREDTAPLPAPSCQVSMRAERLLRALPWNCPVTAAERPQHVERGMSSGSRYRPGRQDWGEIVSYIVTQALLGWGLGLIEAPDDLELAIQSGFKKQIKFHIRCMWVGRIELLSCLNSQWGRSLSSKESRLVSPCSLPILSRKRLHISTTALYYTRSARDPLSL